MRELQVAKLSDPSMTNAKWLEEQMESEADALANDLEHRDATEEEKALLKSELTKTLDEHIEQECRALNNDSEKFSSSIINPDNNKEK